MIKICCHSERSEESPGEEMQNANKPLPKESELTKGSAK